MDAEYTTETGVQDIVITDIDGKSDPTGQSSSPSSLLSNKRSLKDLAYGNCEVYPNGAAYCDNACMCTVTLYTD